MVCTPFKILISYFVKKLLAIFFLSGYLFLTTELSQLLKLPVLIEHFAEHQEQDRNMSFIDFLVHHYGGHEKDADYETDMKLPFMKNLSVPYLYPISAPGNLVPVFKPVYFAVAKPFFSYKDKGLIAAYLSAIWQPPKYC